MASTEPEVIDLTQSFTLVDHSYLANAVIDLDDSGVLPETEVQSTVPLDVSVEIIDNVNNTPAEVEVRIPRSINRARSRRNAFRARSSLPNTSHNTHILTSEVHNTSNLHSDKPLSKVLKKKSQTDALRKAAEDRTRDCSPVQIGSCAICLDRIGKNPLASTKCGHVFCASCLEQSLRVDRKCPTCRKPLRGSNAYHRLFLSAE